MLSSKNDLQQLICFLGSEKNRLSKLGQNTKSINKKLRKIAFEKTEDKASNYMETTRQK